MNTDGSKSSGATPWKELYEAALFEFDRRKLPARIAQAEQALAQRQQELLADGGNCIEERELLDDALYGLAALRRISESRPASDGKAADELLNPKTGTEG
jgi:hypothetical protein